MFSAFGDFTLEGRAPLEQLDYGLRTPQGVESLVELDNRDLQHKRMSRLAWWPHQSTNTLLFSPPYA
jgi:hypothetical protein